MEDNFSISYQDWWKERNSMDLSLPVVLYFDCSHINSYGRVVITPLFHILALIGILGNIWSVYICLRPMRPWTIGSIGILNLALCDLAYLTSMPPRALQIYSHYDWSMGRTLCILSSMLHFVGLTSSTMFICAISVDRFMAIMFPLESRMVRTPRNAALVSGLLWAITVLLIYLSYPNIVYWERKSGFCYCGVIVTSNRRSVGATYSLLSYYCIQVSVPLLLIIPSYIKIIARMKQSRLQWAACGIITQGRDKTIWLIAVFIANFLVCWVPGQLLHIVACIIFFTVYDHTNMCRVANMVNILVEISQLLYCLNACLDPIIFHIQERAAKRICKALVCPVSWWSNSIWKSNKKNLVPPPSVSVVKVKV
ncbi:G-protein coupled receptor 35 [Hypomesus transpacificus]|uniref:G-protein coupled receptor 35 n=1 Tax=Hypomesus transpacificus TaxID=137520 RepID=UPI001F0778EC|nr:G-protein coupled receptor 35 [Hypomesus transpacificus]